MPPLGAGVMVVLVVAVAAGHAPPLVLLGVGDEARVVGIVAEFVGLLLVFAFALLVVRVKRVSSVLVESVRVVATVAVVLGR